jgi:hypothetical protein
MATPDVLVHPSPMARVMSNNGLRIREDLLFTDAQGRERDGVRRKADKVLAKWQDILPAILEKDETVLYVVKNAVAPLSTFEQLTLGWQAYAVMGTTLVFTNARMLHFGIGSSAKWTRVLKSVRWGDVAEGRVKGWLVRVLDLRYLNGKKERYSRLPIGAAKKVNDILAAVIPASRSEMSSVQGVQSLCPDCRSGLTSGTYQCVQCGLKFKNEKTLLNRTLLIPGGGYFYAGMTLAGLLSFVGEGIFLLVGLLYAAMAVHLMDANRAENGRVMESAELWSLAGFLLLLIAFHKLIEYRHGLRVIPTFLPEAKPRA